jgi:leader peptidase (prepilin peptidase)/N-methyltransferase
VQQVFLIKIFIFLFGLAIGSFLNVCIYRMPHDLSIVKPSSFCPKCSSKIKWYHNIPVLSYIILGGKCAYCGENISVTYPLIEILSGLVFLINFLIFGFNIQYLTIVIFESLLLIVIFVDLEHMIIPDEISIGGIVAGFILSFFQNSISWQDSLLGIVIGGGILLLIIKGYYLLTKKEGMGGGDVKLLAMIGAFLGYKSLFFVILCSSFLGTLIGIPIMIIKGKDKNFAIPFGPFLSIAAILYIYFGEKIISSYLNLIT